MAPKWRTSILLMACLHFLLMPCSLAELRSPDSKIREKYFKMPFLRKKFLDETDKASSSAAFYDSRVATDRRSEIMNRICEQFSDPINPEFMALYQNYFEREKMDLEEGRSFSLGNSFTSCLPPFPGNEKLSIFFSHVGFGSDETDSMDPCSAFHLLRSLEPDRSNKPIEHPDYPGVYYVPGRKQRSECHIKPKLAEIRVKAIGVTHPMRRIVDTFEILSQNKSSLVKLVRKEDSSSFWTSSVSFSEFVDYIISQNSNFNSEVLVPYWKSCQICQPVLRPNLVIKAEHLKSDLKFAAKLLEMDSFPEWEDANGTKIGDQLFSTLSRDQIFKLFEIFRLDHELFGYDPRPYFDLANP